MDLISVYIINQKSQPKRLKHCQKELSKYFSPHQIKVFPAYDALYAYNHRHRYFTYKAFQNIHSLQNDIVIPTWASGACAISHYELWKYLVSQKEENFLVVEDDLVITDLEKFLFKSNNALLKLKPPFMCLFDTQENKCDFYIPYPFYYASSNSCNYYGGIHSFQSDIVRLKPKSTGTQCYLVDRLACEKLVSEILPFTYQVDIQLSLSNTMIDLFNIPDGGTGQSGEFFSTVQYYHWKEEEVLQILKQKNLPNELCSIIFKFVNIPPLIQNLSSNSQPKSISYGFGSNNYYY